MGENWSKAEKIASLLLMAISAVAALVMIPEVREKLGLRQYGSQTGVDTNTSRLEQTVTTNDAATVNSGNFELVPGEGFSFQPHAVQPGSAADLSFNNGNLYSLYGLLDLGPLTLQSVHSVPAQNLDFPANLLAALRATFASASSYSNQLQPLSGHTYAVCLGSHGPYATVQILAVKVDEIQRPNRISCSYQYQANGKPSF